MRRIRRSVKRRIVFVTLTAVLQLLLLCVCYVTVKGGIERKYAVLLEEKERVQKLAEREAYVTRTEVKAGECFTEENTEKRYLLSEQNPESLAKEVLGTVAAADLPAGVILNTALCCAMDVAVTERECVFEDILLTEKFSEYALVDVRIRYPNGENYCVLRKKRLRRTEGNAKECRLFLNETEQLLVSAAQYDTERYEGAALYVVGFVEELLQEVSEGTYLPPTQVMLQLCETEETYAEAFLWWQEQRAALETRLSEYGEQCRQGF